MAARILDTDSISQDYMLRRGEAEKINSPAMEALRKYSTPEELAALAPQLGVTMPEQPATTIREPLGDGYDIAIDIPPGKKGGKDALSNVSGIDAHVSAMAQKYNVPEKLIRAVMKNESGGDPNAVSPKRAKGLMQLIDSTAKDMGVTDIFDPYQNIEGGTKYLRFLLDRYQGDTERAVVGYNAGPGFADKWDGREATLYQETRGYRQGVLSAMGEQAPATAQERRFGQSMMADQSGLEGTSGSWRSMPADVPAEKPAPVGPGSEDMALELLLLGRKPEEIEAEISGGLTQPLYSPVDTAVDIGAAVVTGGMSLPATLSAKGLTLASKEGAEFAAKFLASRVGSNVVSGALAGGAMSAAEEAGAGPILQLMAGLLGPTATAALLQMPRAGLSVYLQRMERQNPAKFKELLETMAGKAEGNAFAKRVHSAMVKAKAAYDRSAVANEYGILAGPRAADFAEIASRGKTFKGKYDDMPRFEIDDSQARFFPDGGASGLYERDIERASAEADAIVDAYARANGILKSGEMTMYEYRKAIDAMRAYDQESFDKYSRLIRTAGDTATVNTGTLADVLYHPELYQNYPFLKDIPVKLDNNLDAVATISKDSITLNPDKVAKYAEKRGISLEQGYIEAVLHEIQHGIQDFEGFAVGGSPLAVLSGDEYANKESIGQAVDQYFNYANLDSDVLSALMEKGISNPGDEKAFYKSKGVDKISKVTAKIRNGLKSEYRDNVGEYLDAYIETKRKLKHEYYKKIAGEIEARDVSARSRMSAEERRSVPPYSSENIPRSEAIVKFTGREAMSIDDPPGGAPKEPNFENNPNALMGDPEKLNSLSEVVLTGDMKLPVGWEQASTRSGAMVGGTPKYAGNINLNRIQTPEDIKSIINSVAEQIPVELDEARRGVQSNAATKALASELGLSETTLLKRQRGDAFNAEYALAARMVMLDSANELLTLARQIKAGNNTDEMLARFRERLSVHTAIQAQIAGITAEAGRALQSFRILSEAGILKDRAIKDILQASGGRENIEDMADVLAGVADNAAANGGKIDLSQINETSRALDKATTKDMLIEAWINGLLSGPITHSVNLTSNALFAPWQVAEKKLASVISRSPIGSKEIAAGEATAQAFGLIEGFKDGLIYAGKALKTGQSGDLMGKVDAPQRAITAANVKGTWLGSKLPASALEEGGMAARAVDLLGEGVRIPSRFLTAEDEFFKSIGYRMELNAQAYRMAISEGLTGERLANRILEIKSNPPDTVTSAAIDAARYATFTTPLGDVGQKVTALTNSSAVLKFIMPFVRTPVNIIKRGIERSPLAPAMQSWRADVMAGGARRDLALARASLGSMIMATSATMAGAGYVTGSGPVDKDMREIMRRQGWQPYSIKIGDTYYAYNRIDPIGWSLGVAADYAEIVGQMDELDAEELAGAIVVGLSQNVTNKTYLRGLSEFFAVFSEAQRFENVNRGEQYILNMIGTAVPSILAQTERVLDPTLEDTALYDGVDAVIAKLKSRIPGYSTDLPPRRNVWGDPIVIEGGLGPDIISPIYTSTEKESPIDAELLRLELPIKMPPKNIEGVELKPEEYDRYVTLAGNEAKDPASGLGLKDALEKLIGSAEYKRQSDGDPDEGFDGGKTIMIRRYVQAYRELAKAKTLEEFPELRELVQERARDKAEAKRPGF